MATYQPLEGYQLPHAVNTLSAAFQNDPLYRFIIPDDGERSAFLQVFFAFRLRYGMNFGEVHVTSGTCEAVAVWIRAEGARKGPMLEGGLAVVKAVKGDARRKLLEMQRYVDSMRERVPFPYWHLSPIAVHPAHQRRGLASVLIRSMLERIDREQAVSVLETQDQKNVMMYERYGFRIFCEGTIPGSDTRNWLMTRP